MPRRAWKERAFSSPIVRGIQRHERFQNACGRWFSTVRSFRDGNNVSKALSRELEWLTKDAHADTPVYVFKEVVLNRVKGQSRRADLVFYVPGCVIAYVEYKTVESSSGSRCHTLQLKETLENLIKNLAYKLSCLEDSQKVDTPMTIVALMLTRRFDIRQPDTLMRYSTIAPQGIRDTVKPGRMASILGNMGTRLNKKSGGGAK